MHVQAIFSTNYKTKCRIWKEGTFMQKLSLWEKFSEPTEIQSIENALPRKKYSSVSKHLNTEILVIGAGLAGILTAYRLQEK